MSVTTIVREGALDVEVRGGWTHFMMWCGDQHIPMVDIVEARHVEWPEVRACIDWRVGGGYWPNWFATGWYTFKGRKGARVLLAIYRDRSQLLLVDTKLERPARLVLTVDDADAMAADINRQLARN